jgi:hypothetical protein
MGWTLVTDDDVKTALAYSLLQKSMVLDEDGRVRLPSHNFIMEGGLHSIQDLVNFEESSLRP